jgi:thioesterase domain-containing protein
VICLPSLLATAGPHQYAKFAGALRGTRDILALPLPGFAEGERLPGSLDVAAATQGATIRRLLDGAPFVLAGHSTGGALAYAVANQLEQVGVSPAGVVLIDTYPPESEALPALVSGVMEAMLARESAYVPLSDVRLTAMAAYLRLLGGWRPAELAAPVLLLRAAEPLPGLTGDHERMRAWQFPGAVVQVPGNHFTVMEDHADATAQAVATWLSNGCEV